MCALRVRVFPFPSREEATADETRSNRNLQPEYAAIAKQWQNAKKGEEEEHFFAYIDFQAGPEIFQRVSGTSSSSPLPERVLLVHRTFLTRVLPAARHPKRPDLPALAPNGGTASEQATRSGRDVFVRSASPSPPESLPDVDTPHSGFKAEAIASYLKARAKLPSLEYVRPVDKGAVALNVATAVAAALAIWRLWPYMSIILGRRYIWAASSLVRFPFFLLPSMTLTLHKFHSSSSSS
jgi:oligosaccharyltransferase complex subunit gamma